MTQEFLDNGNLFPGIHTYNWSEFEQQFVQSFPQSQKRPDIYNNFKQWVEQLIDILPPQYIWLDGSYLTQKPEPNDIDLVAFYYPEDFKSQEQSLQVKNLINVVSRAYNCDAYFSLSLEHWPPERIHQLPNNVSIMQTYWMGQFSFDRLRRPKGMVQFSKEELLLLKGGVTS
ncbi:DUF6932 family protein [Paenibacillus cellulositrophicus]|uniref:DUF6932 family protein n=1 Tax=Paenibacillus cellulositrophicus TaxID=562959 RepID=UPI003F8221F1